MIKASAGRQGHAHRFSAAEVAEGLPARIGSEPSFGDDRVFIGNSSSIRVTSDQVLGDKHGHVIPLGERGTRSSVAIRRSWRAPSPLLDAATRKKMGEQAVALAKAVGDSAAPSSSSPGRTSFYFLEMNTRLQVSIRSRLVTGIDLVEQ